VILSETMKISTHY